MTGTSWPVSARMWSVLCALAFLVSSSSESGVPDYVVPEARFQALRTGGLRVSIPDSAGVELFAFHGSVNTPLSHLEAGKISRDITNVEGDRWMLREPEVQLRVGDVIYYWLYVQRRGLGFRADNRYHVVTELVDPEPYTVPQATLEAVHPQGLRVSIPDEPGITIFAFHGNVNQPMPHLSAGMLSADVTSKTNGRWVFHDSNLSLKPGDVVNYWLFVVLNGRGYRKDNQSWTVPGKVTGSAAPASTDCAASMQHSMTTAGPVTPPPQPPSIAAADTLVQDILPMKKNSTTALPEGLEFVVVVKDGRLQVKKQL